MRLSYSGEDDMVLSKHLNQKLQIASVLVSLILLQGCGLIFGGEQRVDNKSHDYTVHKPDSDQGWKKISPENSADGGDVAYEHAASGAVISLNTACKGSRKMSLDELTRTLFIGLRKTGPEQKRNVVVAGTPALESTVNALTNENQTIRIRAVVLSKGTCTYDLMYIAPPATFDATLQSFNAFLKDFRIDE